MSHIQLKPLHLDEHLKKDQQKLVQIQSNLSTLTKQIVNKDIDLIENQTTKITKFSQVIQSILKTVKNHQEKCQSTINQLNNQVKDLNSKIKSYETQFSKTNKQKQYRKQIEQNQHKYLTQWQKRIELSAKVNVEPFLKVNIQDRKSKANQVFKWIIVTIYGEPEAKFYLPNFKEQVFERDQGKDFKERLGKINASNAKEQAKLKTTDFLQNYDQIRSCPELKNVRDQVEKIHTIAEIFLRCYEMSKKIKDLQADIVKSREQFQEKDEQAMRWKARSEALEDRIRTNTQYLNVLKSIQSKLQGKVESYKEKQNISKEVVQRLKNQQTVSEINVNIQDDKRDLCECRIF